MPVDSKKVTRNHCIAWTQLPSVNPLSKRNILIDGPTYNQLRAICKSKYNIELANEPNANAGNKNNEPNNEPNSPKKTDQENIVVERIRTCPFVKFTKPSPGIVTPRRRLIFSPPLDDLTSIKTLYEDLGICEAPPHVNLNYGTALRHMGVGLYQSILDLLHLMHGKYVFPGTWSLTYYKRNLQLDLDKGPMKMISANKGMQTFKDIVDNVNRSGDPILTSVGVYPEGEASGHAIMLVLYKPKPSESLVHVAIIDPNMSTAGVSYTNMITQYVTGQKSRNWDLRVSGRVILPDKYQNADRHTEHSSMDAAGYCATWVCLMIDICARKLTSGMTIHGISDIEECLSMEPISRDSKFLWRKLIIDYMVSRMLAVHTVAHELCEAHCARTHIETDFIAKYAESISSKGIKDEIIRYLGKPGGQAFLQRLKDFNSRQTAAKRIQHAAMKQPLPNF